MATIYYKKLFEVRILHEYYLMNHHHQEFFALNELQRNAILQQRLLNKQYDIWKDVTIAPAEESKRLFQGHHIRFIQQPTGFFIGIRVKPAGNQFIPYIPLDESIHFTFTIDIKNPYFRNITNDGLSNTIPGIYYFDNANAEGNKTFPALSTPVAAYQPDRQYAMGALAVIGGELMEALESTHTPDPSRWKKLNASGLVHEGEKILLPKQFLYRFDRKKNVTTVEFILKTSDGADVKQISFTQPERLEQIPLNFLAADADATDIPNGFYTLEVTGDDNFQEQRKVYLNDVVYNSRYLGVIDIGQNNTDFKLWEADGSLQSPAPIFEIRLKSRSTYWRYLSGEGKKFKVTTKTSPYLTAVQGALLCKAPLPFSFTPIEFHNNDPAIESVFLPNPSDITFRPEEDGRVYANIYLSPIKDLIAEDV